MADLTSLYRNKPKRDLTIQACIDCLNKIALQYPKDFRIVKFAEYFDIAGGTQPPKSTFLYEPKEGYTRFLQIRDFSSEDTPTYIPYSKNNKMCQIDDLILGRYGASVGKILTGKTGAYNVACAKIIFNRESEVEKEYLFYWLHSSYFQNFIRAISRSAQGGFNKNDLDRLEISIPTVLLQKRLVRILNKIDNGLIFNTSFDLAELNETDFEKEFIKSVKSFLSIINENEQLKNELKIQLDLLINLRQQILQDAVQGKLVPQDPDDEPASVLLDKIRAEKEQLIREKKIRKEKPLPAIKLEGVPFEVPEGWVWCRLGDICEISGGKRVPNGYRLLKTPTDHIYIRVTDMKNGTIDDADLHYIDDAVFQKINRYTISKDDVYMTIVGATIGKCGLVPIHFDSMNLTENAAKLHPIIVDKKFLWRCLNSLYCQNQFIDKTKQVAVQKMALNRLSSTLIAIPPIPAQQRIVSKIDHLMTLCDELEQSIRQNQGYTQHLLQVSLKEALEAK